jgi:peptidoglycan/LPS O-acetylase OafA/YrhL
VQELLVVCGLGILNPFVLAIVSAVVTIPLALMSWFLVEKPGVSLKSRLMRITVAPTRECQPG